MILLLVYILLITRIYTDIIKENANINCIGIYNLGQGSRESRTLFAYIKYLLVLHLAVGTDKK